MSSQLNTLLNIGDPAYLQLCLPTRKITTASFLSESHVAVKFSTFWSKDPAMWFYQTEAVFRRARISNQQTMYDYVLQFTC